MACLHKQRKKFWLHRESYNPSFRHVCNIANSVCTCSSVIGSWSSCWSKGFHPLHTCTLPKMSLEYWKMPLFHCLFCDICIMQHFSFEMQCKTVHTCTNIPNLSWVTCEKSLFFGPCIWSFVAISTRFPLSTDLSEKIELWKAAYPAFGGLLCISLRSLACLEWNTELSWEILSW